MMITCRRAVPAFLLRFQYTYAIRNLFTRDTLGITAYIADRNKESPNSDEFKRIFKGDLENRLPLRKLSDNLRKLVHVLDDKPGDVDLLKRALEQFHKHNENLKSKDINNSYYLIGPTVMRALAFLEQPDIAVTLFEDKTIGPIFDQFASYLVLLNLLYEKKMFGELLRIHRNHEARMTPKDKGPSFPSIDCLLIAACFQLNTEDYREYALNLYERIIKNCEKPLRKTIALLAEMTRREGQPEECLEILSNYKKCPDPNIRYIRILAHLDLEQFKEALQLLEVSIQIPSSLKVFPVPEELLEHFEKEIKVVGNEQFVGEFQRISTQLRKMNRTITAPLNDALCYPFPKKFVVIKTYRHTRTHNIESNNVI